MASEELIQRGLTKKGIFVGEYEFFPTHSTTLKQYKNAKIIPHRNYGDYDKRKPDGLLIDRRDKTNPKIIVVLEYKKPVEFQTDKQKKEAIEQCNDLSQVLQSKIGVITDGIVTYWINPNHSDNKNEYKDRTNNIKRSYSFILNDDKQKLQKKFFISETNQKEINKLNDDTKETYQTIERILIETNKSNSILKATEFTDPTPLARSVWQSIYISTKDSPTACLYNVVEIFIFKFLSDLRVLEKDRSFNHLLSMYKEGYSNKEVLEHYATKSRKKIRELFKEDNDGTGIINGTIFVNKDGEPVLSQATLFKDTIEKYDKFGDLRNIKKEFKTKLFETFLKQSKDKSKLGQFFTPRKVVKAIVEMAEIDKAKFICDPFCGVGGFVLEPFQVSSNLKNKFSPKNGKINQHVKLLGYDSGREDNDEQRRTIILAKANMLIYLSDLVEKNPNLNDEFAKLFNTTFHYLSDSNLGTLKEKFESEEDKPDLILTNPPYITSGVTTIRKQIEEEGLTDYYKNSGKGVEGLCLKWIISNLKRTGSAFIILPDSIFNVFANKVLRDEIKKQCFINCIISLPLKTFFNTPKKTYILGITKKDCNEDQFENMKQDFPIFTYLVSDIGETLDINRFEIEENDLDKAKNLFNQFKGSPKTFKTDDPRCKIQPINKFENEKYWIIDRWWSKEEKEKLGISEKQEILTIDEFKEEIENMKKVFDELKGILEEL
jgi:type I restriction-modification system DNA methylase subunit